MALSIHTNYASLVTQSQLNSTNKTLSTAIGEDAGTIEEIFEPYLVQQGFLERTTQGRKVTFKAYKHLGLSPMEGQTEIF